MGQLKALAQYRHSPELAEEFKAVLAGFGATRELQEWANNYARMHAGRCLWDARFVGQRPIKSCLNIGGAPYVFEYIIRKQFPHIQVTSLDIHPERFPNASSVLATRVISCNIETTVPALDEKFDMIVFTEMFEHLRIDILGTVKRIRELLEDGGQLYLTTPNGWGWTAWRLLYLRGRTGPYPVEEWSKLSRLGHMGHVRLYSLLELAEVLRHCGFSIQESGYRSLRRHRGLRDVLMRVRPSCADEILVVAAAQ